MNSGEEFIGLLDSFYRKNEAINLHGRAYVLIYNYIQDPEYIQSQLEINMGRIRRPDLVRVASGRSYDDKNYIVAYIQFNERFKNTAYFGVDINIPRMSKKSSINDCIEIFNQVVDELSEVEFCESNNHECNKVNESRKQYLSELESRIGSKYEIKTSTPTKIYSLIPWDEDFRQLMSDELKVIFGLPNLECGAAFDHIVMKYHRGITLDQVDARSVCSKDVEKIRLTYAFRHLVGMYPNTDKHIAIIDGEPVSYIDKFTSRPTSESKDSGHIGRDVTRKWFKGVEVEDYIKKLPAFAEILESDDIPNSKEHVEKCLTMLIKEIKNTASRYKQSDLGKFIIRRLKSVFDMD